MVVKNTRKSLSRILQRDPNVSFRFDDELNVLKHLRGNLAQVRGREFRGLKSTGLKFLKANSDLFGKISGGMTIVQETKDPQGGKDLILQQYHGKYRVYGGSIRFHVNKDGILDTIRNNLFPDLTKVPRRPKVTSKKAIEIAQKGTKCRRHPEREPELLVYRHEGRSRLAWEVHLNEKNGKTSKKRKDGQYTWLAGDHGAPHEWIAYVDAINGNLFLYFDNLKTAEMVEGSGTGYYSPVTNELAVWYNDTIYQLRDLTRIHGPEIITNDRGASPSEDPDNNWDDLTANPRDQNQGAEVDSHRYVGNAVDYFASVHGRYSFDGNGGTVFVTVHYSTNYNNAIWRWKPISQMFIGDGSGIAGDSGTPPGFDYMCSEDILCHEFTHGVTEYTCNLQYHNESGALNEAFSDIFAAFITKDWLYGKACWLRRKTAPALRNMIDPTNRGQWDNSSEANVKTSVFDGHCPSHYNNRYTGMWDNGGVHINSGIINNLFYLLTIGGTHTVSGITVSGIGQSSAEMMLFRCMTVNLMGIPNATFLEFREAMLDACLDLFPTDSFKLHWVKWAFRAVGIGPHLVPDCTGMTRARAQRTLTDAGLTLGTVKTIPPEPMPSPNARLTPAVVIDQAPKPCGVEVSPGDSVDLTMQRQWVEFP